MNFEYNYNYKRKAGKKRSHFPPYAREQRTGLKRLLLKDATSKSRKHDTVAAGVRVVCSSKTMADDESDESRSIASVSTYNEADHGEEYALFVSDWKHIEQRNAPHYRNVTVANWDDDDFEDVEPSSFTREDWIQLGRAIGGNTTITSLVVSVDNQDDGDDNPIRSIDVQDAFCTGLARNRSIQVFDTSGLDYTSRQMKIMRPFFSHNPQLVEIIFEDGSLDVGAINVLTEAIMQRGGNVKTIRSFEYSRATVSPSHIFAIVELAKTCTHLTSLTLSGLTGGFDISSCQAIASFLAGKKCMLRRLYLNENHINERAAESSQNRFEPTGDLDGSVLTTTKSPVKVTLRSFQLSAMPPTLNLR